MEYLLNKLLRNECSLFEMRGVCIDESKKKEEIIREMYDEILVGLNGHEQEGQLSEMLNFIEDLATNLDSDEDDDAFCKGMSYGAKVCTKLIENEKKNNIDLSIQEKYSDIEYYNEVKKRAVFNIDKKIENYHNVEILKNCSRDEVIDNIVNKFYSPNMSQKNIDIKMSKEYVMKNRYLCYYELKFLNFVNKEIGEKFKKYVEYIKLKNNYDITNTYLSGFRIGARLIREFDNVYKEVELENMSKVEDNTNI